MTPDIILNKGQILLTQTTSGLGIVMNNSPFINGTVELVNDLSDTWEVGDLVLFDPLEANKFSFDGDIFYLITEDKIFYKENYIPPP